MVFIAMYTIWKDLPRDIEMSLLLIVNINVISYYSKILKEIGM